MKTITPTDISQKLGTLQTINYVNGSSEVLSVREFNKETNEIKCLNMVGCIELRFGNREIEQIEADSNNCKTILFGSIKDMSDIQLHRAYH